MNFVDTNLDGSQETFNRVYEQSLTHSDDFWAKEASEHLTFFKAWSKVSDCNLESGENHWFIGAKLNACYNCLDRHLDEHAEKTAFIWEADEPGNVKHYTYQMVYEATCQLANALKSKQVKKGDRVCIYMPMIPEAIFAMLACARIGAVHSVVFAGFSPLSLESRINDANATVVITANEGQRGGKTIPLKDNVDAALLNCPQVHTVFVKKRTNTETPFDSNRDVDYDQMVSEQAIDCTPEVMDAEDPLFILYTSGSTGKPKGVVHTQAGYLLYTALTFKTLFNYQANDTYWCTADVGWITGHSYIVYGPLLNAATSVIFEGPPNYPTPARLWEMVDRHQVNIFYTAPTAIRALMGAGDQYLETSSRTSLSLLGTVGEPINPEAWRWYSETVGKGRCPIIDTWWQTETGGVMISPTAYQHEQKPGAATKPFFGVQAALLDDTGQEINGPGSGKLVIKQAWPGMCRTIYGDHDRYLRTYFSPYPGYYLTGDNARRDADGDYWITGRIDDVLNVSGHRLGTAEIESALVAHPSVSEAAVVGIPHDVKGEAIYAYVTLKQSEAPNAALKAQLISWVGQQIGAIAKPQTIQWAPNLPKTRSGKIMRRILRYIAVGKTDYLGDISTLAAPEVIDELIHHRAADIEPEMT